LFQDSLRQFLMGILSKSAQVGAQKDGFGMLVVQYDGSGVDAIVNGLVARWKRILRRRDVHFGRADK